MFDACPRDDDDHGSPEPRAVVLITLGYDGQMETEIHLDPGDELAIADALRIAADDIAADVGTRPRMN